jgi:hypothetical protein
MLGLNLVCNGSKPIWGYDVLFEISSVIIYELFPRDNVFFVSWCEVMEASYA